MCIYNVNNICYSLVTTVAILTNCRVGSSIRYKCHKTRERNAKKRNIYYGYCRNKIAVNGTIKPQVHLKAAVPYGTCFSQ
jgi:hypothetical protein